MSGRPGVEGITERLSRCNQRLVVQLIGRDAPTDEQLGQIKDNISQDVSLSSGQSRTTADWEIGIQKRSSLFTDEDLDEFLGAIRQELVNSHQVEGWIVES